MSLDRLLNQPVEILNTTDDGTDALGRPVTVDLPPFVTKGRVSPATSEDLPRSDDVTYEEWNITVLPEAPLRSSSRVRAHGLEFEVVGIPATRRTARGPKYRRGRLRIVGGDRA